MDIVKNDRKSILLNVYIESNMDKDFFILSSKRDAFLIVDLEGRFAYVNQVCERLIGYSNADILSMELSQLFVSSGLTANQKFFKGKDTESLANFDAALITNLGEKMDVNITSFPIFFEDEYLGNYIVLKDVTHLKVKRSMKMERERHYWRLIEHSPEPIFILDETTIVNVNKSGVSMLGAKNKGELIDTSILKVIHPDFHEVFQWNIGRVDRAEITDLFTLKMGNLAEEVLDVAMKAFPTIYKGEPACHIIVQDKSESMRLTRISEKQAVAGQLAAGVAHEIRNPITAIKGFLQLIMREHKDNFVYFEIIDSEITRIETILKELMVLAKPAKHKDESVNIRLLLDQVVTLMEAQALLNDIQIEKNYSNLNVSIRGDENQLKQVFINYLKNSIDAMPGGGKLLIKGIYKEEDIVRVKIIDQGGGIPQEIINKVGDPFFTTKENGTGLGMLVSSQIIKEHKGMIEISSDLIGTCVEVSFPIKITQSSH